MYQELTEEFPTRINREFFGFNRELELPYQGSFGQIRERAFAPDLRGTAGSVVAGPATDVGPGETHRLLGTLCRHLCGLIPAKDEAPARDGLAPAQGEPQLFRRSSSSACRRENSKIPPP